MVPYPSFMKPKTLSLISASVLALAANAAASTVFISEFHYDNAGGDVGEFVEIYVQNGTTLADVTVTLYNGSNGTNYNSETADQMTSGGTVTLGGVDFNIYAWTVAGIQNGSPDGIAIDVAGDVCEFISYEGGGGDFAATNGPASGLTSTNVGVSETSSTTIGSSIERIDNAWVVVADDSPGVANAGLTTNPLAVPEPSTAFLGGLALLGLFRRRR